jgi:hypothetical protein
MYDGDILIIFLFIGGIITTIILIVVLEWLWMIKNFTNEMAKYTKSTAEYASFIYQNILSSSEKDCKEKKACIKEYFPYAEYIYMNLTPEEKIQADREDLIHLKRKPVE